MKKLHAFKLMFLVYLATASTLLYAQSVIQPEPQTTSFPIVQWVSKTAGDTVTIENGTGANLNIVINVADDGSTDPAGVTLNNCGETTSIAAGSSAICITSDVDRPVSFSSDKNKAATGTYQITQQLPAQ